VIFLDGLLSFPDAREEKTGPKFWFYSEEVIKFCLVIFKFLKFCVLISRTHISFFGDCGNRSVKEMGTLD